MRKDVIPNFSQLVCGAPSVRAAFASHQSMRLWWRLVLRLHGKPLDVTLPQSQKVEAVAAGFRFYAGLYRALAVLFLLMAPVFVGFDVAQNSAASSYWALASGLAGVYLWLVSGLGYAGAKSYGAGHSDGTVALVAFMAMIIAFLSAFIAVISVAAQSLAWLASAPNLVATAFLFVFGVGSYLIEIVYLVTESFGNQVGQISTQ